MKAAPRLVRPTPLNRYRIERRAFCLMAIRVQAGAEPVRLLFLAARPLREPIVQYGPFVMNTREEIEQALADYRNGRLAAAA
jgi:redox-sensitive bicupin YhaK (pirin superfamily)